MADTPFDWKNVAEEVDAVQKDEGKVAGTVARNFLKQYRLSDQEREQIIEEFISFCYSAAKTMLITAPIVPNRTGQLIVSVVPLDKETQVGVETGSLIPKTSTARTKYQVTRDWDPALRPVIENILDPLYAGLAAARSFGITNVPKLQQDKAQERENPVIDLAQPMVLEMTAMMAVRMPWGENPYRKRTMAYSIVLEMLQIYPSLLMQAARDPLAYPGGQFLRDIELILDRRFNGQVQ